jgi:hypothetical protein
MQEKKSWRERMRGHGNIFTPHAGSMLIHVHRESGLAHRTMTLEPWQVQMLRLFTSRWFLVALTIGLLSWGYFAFQAARVPFLKQRITYLEDDARRMDTLQARLGQLQARYDQVQRMLSVPPVNGTKAVKTAKSVGSDSIKPD